MKKLTTIIVLLVLALSISMSSCKKDDTYELKFNAEHPSEDGIGVYDLLVNNSSISNDTLYEYDTNTGVFEVKMGDVIEVNVYNSGADNSMKVTCISSDGSINFSVCPDINTFRKTYTYTVK